MRTVCPTSEVALSSTSRQARSNCDEKQQTKTRTRTTAHTNHQMSHPRDYLNLPGVTSFVKVIDLSNLQDGTFGFVYLLQTHLCAKSVLDPDRPKSGPPQRCFLPRGCRRGTERMAKTQEKGAAPLDPEEALGLFTLPRGLGAPESSASWAPSSPLCGHGPVHGSL